MTPKYAAAALSALIAYFAYHAFAGEQGLGRWSDLQEELAAKQAQLEAIQAANDALRRDITRLTPGRVDADLVEVLAREDLDLVYPDEIIVINAPTEAAF
ncbi:MAG: septum formation initiator [Henriciella sp.]|jgi:cell division protein FtsB|uniref:FtsB family cell division protein n=1 Tax=Henriciella sp. TaxID=1968823 RepID=UPI000C0EE3B0|nr:septum formation initiator family protein [Henriciella sp.]MAN75293.1 septum formation initiator [Henriciella sp.]MBF33448.1 septum formation initiator [Hyphomonadaceae bacterium]MBK75237.1 septum formation initiator [Henriciella sp.]PHR79866.1 MAG: septum formation initiator [Henriciella sp.]|tara:strand:+ start:2144 stop:2443 length:300 start_codon:yes stop_codon:yes gene_type:complete